MTLDSLGRVVPHETPLIDNIREQITVMRTMGKNPSTLRIDPLNWDAFVDELGPLLPMYPVPVGYPTVFGLRVEFTSEPDFEVIE